MILPHPAAETMNAKRIFWFGMHKVLRQTELVQLRSLGYEVFSPAYLSPIYDQSADLNIDYTQKTTLPLEVFTKLINYNFFYNNISDEIAEILNTYFGSAIVTISAVWLRSFLAAYSGPVIYRVYGQHLRLSDQLIEMGLWDKLISRNDFSVVPFAAETLDREHDWFTALCHEIVPYQIPDDVFDHSGNWQATRRRPAITTHIPNVENAYYAAAYSAFRAHYPQRIFEITGPQRSHPQDSSFVGALPRAEFLARLMSSSGFFYNYRDDVCYLTPIEMMEVGGPVLYAPDSLLARFFGGPTPGLISHPTVAGPRLKALLHGDKTLISEIISAQEPVRKRYDRAYVRPAFEEAFQRLLGNPRRSAAYTVEDRIVRGAHASSSEKSSTSTIVAFLHDETLLVRNGQRADARGAAAQMLADVVRAAAASPDCHHISLICLERTQALALDLFSDEVARGRASVYPLLDSASPNLSLADRLARVDFIEHLNTRSDVEAILLPHPNLFPEALLFKGKRIVCVPDYQPVQDRLYAHDGHRAELDELEEVTTETLLTSDRILVSTNFTHECLVRSAFGQDIAGKIDVFPLPWISQERPASSFRRETEFVEKTAGRRFLFYPNVNLPNGNYAFLMKALATARAAHPDLMVVVTDRLGRIPGVGEIADAHDLKPHIVELGELEQSDYQWLYSKAAALAYVSLFDGTLPLPIVDGIRNGLPVISTRLPILTEALGTAVEQLLLYRTADVEDFTSALDKALNDRAGIAKAQSDILPQLQSYPTGVADLPALLRRGSALSV